MKASRRSRSVINQSHSILLANGSVNAVGALLATGGFIPLVVRAGLAAAQQSVRAGYIVGVALFGGCVIFRFVIATINAFMSLRRPRPSLRALEEAGTFFLPAGIYMPFILTVLQGLSGWLLLGLSLFYAVSGFLLYLTIIGVFRTYAVSLGYLFFFVAVPLLPPFSGQFGDPTTSWLLAAALVHAVGLVFKNRPGFPYSDAVWQAFVVAGMVLQYSAIVSIFGR